MSASLLSSGEWRLLSSAGFFAVQLLYADNAVAQQAPAYPGHPWHSPAEQEFQSQARWLREAAFSIDPARTYSLGELIDLAETQNPQTRLAWEGARAQAATLGVARSELYPMLTAVALTQLDHGLAFTGPSVARQTVQDFEGRLDLAYTIFDFGARSGRISAAKAEVLAANFVFNDSHRRVIYQVEQAYYQLLNAAGQLDAAKTSLTNAQTVLQASEDRLNHGLATLPDVLEARSAAAQSEYEFEAVLGAQDIARGNLAKALGSAPTFSIQLQPLDDLATPDSISDTVEQALDRSFQQRPDLMEQLARVRAANARVQEARAAFYPTLNLSASGGWQAQYGTREPLSWVHNESPAGGVGLSLSWPLFDGSARRSKLARAKADVLASEANVNATRDAVAEEVWRAYSNLRTAFRQRQSALALLSAATQSYAAALESYNRGVRNLLDVTAAQRTLAQARSTDVLARTDVLAALTELAFRTGDSIQQTARKTRP
jgi:outer membrane protein